MPDRLDTIGEKLKGATMDPQAAIQYAAEIALQHWGKAHEKADDLRVQVAQAKVKLLDENEKMSKAEVDVRVEATELFREYIKAEHQVRRIEEFIKIAKKHADVNRY